MKVFPAIDVREGACVQLVGGDYAHEKVRIADPLEASRRWAEAGLTAQHVVDLDAATGRGENRSVIERLAKQPRLSVQVGGGVRTREDIERLVAADVARVVVGTRGVEDGAWLREMASAFPKRIVLAADVKGGRVVTRGWSESTSLTLDSLLGALNNVPLAAVLVTVVDVEGQMQGPDVATIASAVRATRLPVQASGGITTLDDLARLEAAGVVACVLGMALYAGKLDPIEVARRYPS